VFYGILTSQLKYKNDMFVADFNNGILYHFQLNKQRNGVLTNGSLTDKVASYQDLINCDSAFKCIINSSIGCENSKRSFELSTNKTKKCMAVEVKK
jgi:hypothetical protein